jgi:hypothetical protein
MSAPSSPILMHPRRLLAVYYLLPPSLQKSVLLFVLLVSTLGIALIG